MTASSSVDTITFLVVKSITFLGRWNPTSFETWAVVSDSWRAFSQLAFFVGQCRANPGHLCQSYKTDHSWTWNQALTGPEL